MGSLTLPPSGIVYIDTSVLIYTVEQHAATALSAGCSAFVTNDVSFRSVSSLPWLILKDVVDG